MISLLMKLSSSKIYFFHSCSDREEMRKRKNIMHNIFVHIININQEKNNINYVHGVSRFSARWGEYFLLCHRGSMTLYDELHSPALAIIQQGCMASLLQSLGYSSCEVSRLSCKKLISYFVHFFYIALYSLQFVFVKLNWLAFKFICLSLRWQREKNSYLTKTLSHSTQPVNMLLVPVDINKNSE